MTNKTKTRKGKKGLKLLDLSFDCETQSEPKANSPNPAVRIKTAWTRSAPVGYKPHGGKRGLKGYPPSPYSFNKSADYQNQLQTDLEQLITAESLTHVTSPTWAIAVSRESNHSGESPLFVHRLLSPSKYDKSSHRNYSQNMYGRRRPLSANDANRYHPNSTHRYLTRTGLKDMSQSEVDLRLGKPTRTTLLRARLRVNSAPQNAYDIHREYVRKADKLAECRKMLMPSYSLQDLLTIPLEDETLHGFLTGARYNRAHYLDAKSLVAHGVYMPRSNPGGCFLIPRNKNAELNAERHLASQEYSEEPNDETSYKNHMDSTNRQMSSPVPPPQRPSSPQPMTNGNGNNKESGGSSTNHPDRSTAKDDGTECPSKRNGNNEPDSKDARENDQPLTAMRKILAADEGLSVKGRSLDGLRLIHHHSISTSGTAVPIITGTSISRQQIGATSNRQALIGHPLISPAPRIMSSRSHRREEWKARPTTPTAEKAPVQMEDKCFNVPSVNGDEDKLDELHDASSKEKRSHVRFADEMTLSTDSLNAAAAKSCPTTDVKEADSETVGVASEKVDVTSEPADVSIIKDLAESEQVPSARHSGKENENIKETDVQTTDDVEQGDNVIFFMTEDEDLPGTSKDANIHDQGHEEIKDTEQEAAEQSSQCHVTTESKALANEIDDDADEEKEGQSNDLQADDVEPQAQQHDNSVAPSSEVLSQDDGDMMPNGVISVEISKCERTNAKDAELGTQQLDDVVDQLSNHGSQNTDISDTE